MTDCVAGLGQSLEVVVGIPLALQEPDSACPLCLSAFHVLALRSASVWDHMERFCNLHISSSEWAGIHGRAQKGLGSRKEEELTGIQAFIQLFSK